MFSSRFMLFPTFTKKCGVKKPNYFSFNVFFMFFMLEILKSAPSLTVKWEVVSPNSRYREFNMRLEILKSAPSLTG